MNIKENININDGISGIFTIVDEHNNIVIKKHNTVVNAGKLFIAKTLVKQLGTTITDSITSNTAYINKSVFKKIAFCYSHDHSITTQDLIYSKISSSIVKSVNLDNSKVKLICDTNSSIYIQFTIELISDETIHFNSIALLLGTVEDNDTYQLFSRVTIDDVYLESNMKYTLKYSLYF